MYPKISIVTVSYNQADFIEENIESVINQNYPNVEHIIIDAGSTDGTIEILKKYDRYLNWISEPDNGQSDGLNRGFKKASGEIIGWINSDDALADNALYRVADFFKENPNEVAVVGNQMFIDENSNKIKIVNSSSYSYDYLLNNAKGITQNSTFFKKEIFSRVGYLDESLHYAMDHDLFIRITTIKDIPHIPYTLAKFRMQPKAKTAEGGVNFAKDLLYIRKKYKGKLFSAGNWDSIYIILTEPLRKILWFRRLIQSVRGVS